MGLDLLLAGKGIPMEIFGYLAIIPAAGLLCWLCSLTRRYKESQREMQAQREEAYQRHPSNTRR